MYPEGTRAGLLYPESHGSVDFSADKRGSDDMSDARIGAQLSFLNEQIEKAHALLVDLTSVLDPILYPSFPEPTDDMAAMVKQSAPMTSVISKIIDDINRNAVDLQTRIVSLQRRVQL